MGKSTRPVKWQVVVTAMICITILAVASQLSGEGETFKIIAAAIIAFVLGIPLPSFWRWVK